MRFPRTLSAFLLAAACIAPLSAADAKWLHITSPHFDMFTSESEGDSKAALQHLEATRAYFLAATHFKDPFTTQQVRVVVFHSDGDFSKFRPNDVGQAKVYSLAAGAAPAAIVTLGVKQDMYDQLVREYAQLVLDDSARALPYWFRAGLAMVYSTLKPTDAGMNLGAAAKSNFRNGQIADVDLQMMASINREALLASRDKANVDFYAVQSKALPNALDGLQSTLNETQDFSRAAWMLVHMLMFQPDYKAKFGEYMRTVATGTETGAAFVKVYEKPLTRVKTDLITYATQTGITVMTAPFKAEKVSPESKAATKEEQDRIFADLGKH